MCACVRVKIKPSGNSRVITKTSENCRSHIRKCCYLIFKTKSTAEACFVIKLCIIYTQSEKALVIV